MPRGVGFGKRWEVKDNFELTGLPSFTLHLLPQFRAIETTMGVRESQASMLLPLLDKSSYLRGLGGSFGFLSFDVTLPALNAATAARS